MRLLEKHPQRVGYLLKERVSNIAVLADALQRISEGECVIDPTIGTPSDRIVPPGSLRETRCGPSDAAVGGRRPHVGRGFVPLACARPRAAGRTRPQPDRADIRETGI